MTDIVSIGHSIFDIYMDMPLAHLHEGEVLGQKEMCMLWGAKYQIERLNTGLGGNALNVSTGLKTIGLEAELVTAFGNDVFGAYARTVLKQRGFDMRFIQSAARSDLSVILNFQGDRTILGFHSDEPYVFPVADIEREQPKWLFLSSIGLETFPELYQEIAAYMQAHPQTMLAYNPGGREIKEGKAARDILRHVNLLIVNLEEAIGLTQRTDIHKSAMPDKEKAIELMRDIKGLGAKMTVITNGGKGAYGYDGEHVYHQEPFPTEMVERTGAGDAFSCGVIAALFNGHKPSEALRWGAAQSASVMRVPGASRGFLSAQAMEKSLHEHTSLQPQRLGAL